MKGPGLRLDLDLRRAWECAACGARRRTAGEVTSLNCGCRPGDPVPMRLVEPLRRTASPFDHVGFAAQKRIDAALRRSVEGPPEPPEPSETESADPPPDVP